MLFESYPDIGIATRWTGCMTARFLPIQTKRRTCVITPLMSWQNLWPLGVLSNITILWFYGHLVASPLTTAVHCKPPKVNMASKSSTVMGNSNKLKHRNLIIACRSSEMRSLFFVPAKNSMNPYQIDSRSRWLIRYHKVLPYKII